jgi:hypothetical protein
MQSLRNLAAAPVAISTSRSRRHSRPGRSESTWARWWAASHVTVAQGAPVPVLVKW